MAESLELKPPGLNNLRVKRWATSDCPWQVEILKIAKIIPDTLARIERDICKSRSTSIPVCPTLIACSKHDQHL